MSRSQSHIIQAKAENIFEGLIPTEWVHRAQTPDYEIDYVVEVYENEVRSALTFAVQVKGASKLARSANHVTLRLKTKDIVEYAERVRDPVFVVAVDVTSGDAYWLFAQEYSDNLHAANGWRSKKKISVKIPNTNDLRKADCLLLEIRRACRYMSARHPAAIEDAIKSEIGRLETLDPRIEVEIEATKTSRRYRLLPKTPIHGEFTIAGDPTRVAMMLDDLIARGLPIDLEPGQLQMTGSPLLEHLATQTRKIEMAREAAAFVSLIGRDSDGVELGRIEGMNCTLRGGTREWRGVADSGQSLLSVAFKIATGFSAEQTFSLRFSLRKWAGQPLRRLSAFEEINSVFGTLPHPPQLAFQCIVNGHRVFRDPVGIELLDQAALGAAHYWLNLIAKARVIADYFDIDPIFEPEMSRELRSNIVQAYDLIMKKEHVARVKRFRVTTQMKLADARRMLLTDDCRTGEGTLRLNGQFRFELFGCEVVFDAIQIFVSSATVTSTKSTITKKLQRCCGETVGVKWGGTEGSQITYSVTSLPTTES